MHHRLDDDKENRPTGDYLRRNNNNNNNSDKPYFDCRYDRQRRRSIRDSFVRSFVREAITSKRAVVFLRDLENDPNSRFVRDLFLENCRPEELEFYVLDHTPPSIADGVQRHLVHHFSKAMVSKNCFVFVRGTHVPIWHLRKILAVMVAASKEKIDDTMHAWITLPTRFFCRKSTQYDPNRV